MNKYHGHYANAQDSRPRWAPEPYTAQHAEFIRKAMAEHHVTDEQLRAVFPSRPSSAQEAQKVLAWVNSQNPASYDGIAPKPEAGKRAQPWHYALRDDGGTVHFYRVKAGRKEGFYFLDVQASDDYYPVKNRVIKKVILDAINADRDAALALYGREIGRCGRCGRTLTSKYRELGIGPVCIDK